MPWIRTGGTVFGAVPYDGVLRVTPYTKLVGYATIVYPGDFVKLASDGTLQVAAAGDAMIGVAGAYSPASTADTVPVYDHPDQLFMVMDDASATLAQTAVGNNFDIVATTGDTTIKRSKHSLAANDASGTATAGLRLVSLHPAESAFGTSKRYVVRINEHQSRALSTTASAQGFTGF